LNTVSRKIDKEKTKSTRLGIRRDAVLELLSRRPDNSQTPKQNISSSVSLQNAMAISFQSINQLIGLLISDKMANTGPKKM